MSKNKVKYGLKNVHYAAITELDGVVTYAKPVPIPGGVSLTMDAQSARNAFWADNREYFSSEANQGYSGSLEVALLPDSFRKDILDEVEDANKVLIENKDAKIKPFALLFEFEGDANAIRHIFYNVDASRPGVSGTTTNEQGKNVQTETMNIHAVPAVDTGDVKAKVTADLTPYESFFDEVYTKATEALPPAGN